jgi:hypothetical protein
LAIKIWIHGPVISEGNSMTLKSGRSIVAALATMTATRRLRITRRLFAPAAVLAFVAATGFAGAGTAAAATEAACVAAYQASTGSLSSYDILTDSATDQDLGMATGTHPAIAQLTSGAYEMAIEASHSTSVLASMAIS